MTLSATKTPTGYLVEGTDAVGKDVEMFFDSNQTRNFDYLTEVESNFHKETEYQTRRAQLPDPERDLLVEIFGRGNEPTDSVLHTTLVEPQEAVNGIALDWSQDPVTAVLKLITEGQSNRLRLIAGALVDMGPSVPVAGGTASPATGEGDPGSQFIG